MTRKLCVLFFLVCLECGEQKEDEKSNKNAKVTHIHIICGVDDECLLIIIYLFFFFVQELNSKQNRQRLKKMKLKFSLYFVVLFRAINKRL